MILYSSGSILLEEKVKISAGEAQKHQSMTEGSVPGAFRIEAKNEGKKR